MTFPILVVDRDAAVKKLAQFGRSKRLFKVDREQRFDLVEKEAAIAVSACDQRLARLGSDRKRALLDRFSAADQLLKRLDGRAGAGSGPGSAREARR